MTASMLHQRVSQTPIKWTLRLAITGLGLVIATTAVYLSVASQPVRRVKIVEVVSPDANGILVDGKQVKSGAEVISGQRLTTQQNAKVELQQSDTIGARLGKNSSLLVEGDCIQLVEGQAVISGTQACVGAIIVNSKDGIYTVERVGYLADVKVLAGQVEVVIPSNPAIASLTLKQNQKLTLSLAGDDVGPVRLMLPTEVDNLIKGELFQGFQIPLPNQSQIPGLPKPIATAAPTPATPTPVKSALTPAPPATPAQQVSVSADKQHPTRSAYVHQPDVDESAADLKSSYSSPRYARSKWAPEPATSRYSSRRKWWRSPYASSSYRRKPSYSAPSNDAPSAPVEVPTAHPPVDLPPTEPPISPVPGGNPPLPPPVIVEPVPGGPPLPANGLPIVPEDTGK